MTDYKKLVEALRYCSTTKGMVYCNVNCKYGWEERSEGCKDVLMTDAAAAIEELQDKVVELEEWLNDDDVAADDNARQIEELEKRNAELHAELERWVSAAEKAGEPKRGEWIYKPKGAIEMMFTLPKCSVCGHESSDANNYCPNCGAKMEVQDGK